MNFHFLWRLLYNNSAHMYEFLSLCVSLGRWRAWCRASIPFLQRKRVLELAHGPGHLLIALKRAGYEPWGIDLSPRMVKRARRRLRRARISVPLVRCRAQALPFVSGSFDEVVATFPTDYIFDADTIREVARVTTERGRLVAVVGAQHKGLQPDLHFVEWLRHAMGEGGSREERRKSPFVQAGMKTRIEHKSVGGGMVTLIIADKIPKDGKSGALQLEQTHPQPVRSKSLGIEKQRFPEGGCPEETAQPLLSPKEEPV